MNRINYYPKSDRQVANNDCPLQKPVHSIQEITGIIANGKIKVELTLPEVNHTIIVSQEMAAPFREWILNA